MCTLHTGIMGLAALSWRCLTCGFGQLRQSFGSCFDCWVSGGIIICTSICLEVDRILSLMHCACSGEYTGTAVPIRWSANTCTPYDYFGWQYYLEDWAFANGLQDILPRYRHR